MVGTYPGHSGHGEGKVVGHQGHQGYQGHGHSEGKVVGGNYNTVGHCHDPTPPPPPPHQGEAPALPVKTKDKTGKREHGTREREGRERPDPVCVDCNNAPNGGMEGESGYNTGSRNNRDNAVESGYSTGTRVKEEPIQYIDADNCQVRARRHTWT